MSTEDWIMSVGLGPLILIGGWIQTYRVWRRQADVSAGISWATGAPSAPGYHAFLLPAATALTLLWFGTVLDEIGGPDAPGALEATIDWAMGLGCLVIFFAFWMWAFMRPRFLVPPHLRGQRGWIASSWHDWREARTQVGGRRDHWNAKPGGDHARR